MALGDAVSVRPVAPIEAPLAVAPIGDARQEAFQRALQLTVGQKLQGEILSRMNDGSFMVRVAGTAARMMLPAGTQVGGNVALTLVATDPRPTFALGADDTELSALGKLADGLVQNGKLGKSPQLIYLDSPALSAEEAAAMEAAALSPRVQTKTEKLVNNFVEVGNLTQTDDTGAAAALRGKGLPLTEAEQAAANAKGNSSAPAAFSSTAKLINELIQTAQENNASTSIKPANPLLTNLTSAKVDTSQVATALHDTLTFSGLFYESHVTEWADGKRSMADLMREPQAQLNTQLGNQGNAIADGQNVALAQLVNQQLNTLEHQRTSWQGEIWPGQQMEWDVQKDDSDNADSPGSESERTWQSAVRFDLPSLGMVSASIQMIGEHVQIQVRTASEKSAVSLRTFAGKLSDALGAAGSKLDQLTVRQDDHV